MKVRINIRKFFNAEKRRACGGRTLGRKKKVEDQGNYDEYVPVYLTIDQIFVLRDLVMHIPMCTMKNDLIGELGHGISLFGSNHSLRIKKEGSNWDEYENENKQLKMNMKNIKSIELNKDAAVVIRFTEEMVKDYTDCKKKAAVPDGPGKNCKKCSLDIPGDMRNCLLTMFSEIEEELEKRKAGDHT